ncbi:hypothetical protein, partial [Photobacterium profundum]|uniref:hypothetical protein n=1 Tax=Photobacterium profundum TaxID=74109 RepID=UPI003D1367C8
VIIIKYISAFLVGFLLYDLILNKRFYFIFLYLSLIALTLFFIDFNTFVFDFSIYDDIKDRNSYLILSDIFTVCHFLAVPLIKNKTLRCVFTLVSVFILFSLGSRTSLYIMVFVSLYLELILNSKELKRNTLVLLSIIVPLFFIDFNHLLDLNERMFGFLFGHSDYSVTARTMLSINGVNAISNNLFFGDFMGQVNHGGGGTLLGSYMHDYRSYLRQFGLIGFIPFVILQFWLIYIYIALQINSKHYYEPYRNVFICVFLFLFIETLSSRAFNYSFWMLLVGLSISIFNRNFNEKY